MTAPWEVPVAGLPPHPRSDALAARLWTASDRPGNLALTFDTYTFPVYDARRADRMWPVAVEHPDWGGNLPASLPWNRAWKGAAGSDGQAVVVDPDAGLEWDLWRVRVGANGTLRVGNGSVFALGLQAWPPSRGCGIPYLAMLVRPAEVARGLVPHALPMPINGVHKSDFVPPATKTDGPTWGVEDGIPEGTRFALRVADDEIEAWIRQLPVGLAPAFYQSARVIARALRDFGWVITDHGGAAHLQFESNQTAGHQWTALGLGATTVGGKEYPRDMLDGLMSIDRIYGISPPPYPEVVTDAGSKGTPGSAVRKACRP